MVDVGATEGHHRENLVDASNLSPTQACASTPLSPPHILSVENLFYDENDYDMTFNPWGDTAN